jgi:uncharacterized protein (DUF1330 family)
MKDGSPFGIGGLLENWKDPLYMEELTPVAFVAQGLHAQANPPIYVVAEIDVSNLDAYLNEYVPLTQAAIKAAGGRILAVGQNITRIKGTPPKRASIQHWESVEQYNAYRESAAFVDSWKMRDKYAKLRSFASEGMPQ